MTERIEYYLIRLLFSLARAVPYAVASRIGAMLGILVYSLTGFRFRVTMENLRRAFPEKRERELRNIARGAYRNYGIAVTQMLWAGGANEEELKSVLLPGSIEIARLALEKGRGTVLLSAHYGGWEFLVSSVRLHLGHPLVAIVQRQRNKRIDALVDGTRRRFGNETFPMGPSTRHVLQALKEGKCVLALGDQSGPKEAIFVEFFGRPAATHRGPAVLALRYGSPLVMVFLHRLPDHRYELLAEEVDTSDLTTYSEENIEELTRRHVVILEQYIRRYPDHWLWMHKRWKHAAYYEGHHGSATP